MIQPTTKKKKYIYIYMLSTTRGHWSLDYEQFFFSWSVETNARYTQMTTHVTVGARRSSLDSLKIHFFRFRPLLRWFKIDKKAIIKMSINNCNLLIHTCAKLFILGSYIKQWQICHRSTGNPGSVMVPQYSSSKITVFVWGKNTILKFLGNTE